YSHVKHKRLDLVQQIANRNIYTASPRGTCRQRRSLERRHTRRRIVRHRAASSLYWRKYVFPLHRCFKSLPRLPCASSKGPGISTTRYTISHPTPAIIRSNRNPTLSLRAPPAPGITKTMHLE